MNLNSFSGFSFLTSPSVLSLSAEIQVDSLPQSLHIQFDLESLLFNSFLWNLLDSTASQMPGMHKPGHQPIWVSLLFQLFQSGESENRKPSVSFSNSKSFHLSVGHSLTTQTNERRELAGNALPVTK